MTAVLQNVVNTLLESSRVSTLIDMKRFLIEESFREEFLTSVDDPTLHYYWNNEYHMVSKRIAPLLTRIDTFLRPKTIRYMLAQKKGIDLRKCMDEGKIILIKLSQGLIGEENSFMLGSMMLAKFNQAAMSRQSLSKEKRKPFFVYCDEFQNSVTPSIVKILSGARKYGLGLILAHQELAQISDPQVLNSVISNPYTRVCFRLGDADAHKLESVFSYFDQSDLQNLGRGEVIMRIGSSSNDFNLKTFPLPSSDEDYSNDIVDFTRNRYGTPRQEVEKLLVSMLPDINTANNKKESLKTDTEPKITKADKEQEISTTKPIEDTPIPPSKKSFEEQKQEILDKQGTKEQETLHRSLQNYISKLGKERNFKTEIEKKTSDGKYIDVFLSNDQITIAAEVSVTNSIDYEVQNLQKCINANADHIFLVSESKVHRENIKKRAKEYFNTPDFKRIKFGDPSAFLKFINKHYERPNKSVKKSRGYRITSSQVDFQGHDAKERNKRIQDIIAKQKKS